MARKSKTPEFKAGDRVAYSVQWLKSVGMSHSSYAHARGVVTETKPFGSTVLVSIDWTAGGAAPIACSRPTSPMLAQTLDSPRASDDSLRGNG